MRRFLLALLLFCPALPAQDEEPEIEIDEPPGTDEPEPSRPPPAREGKVQPKASLQERVNAAIDKGVLWLKQRQGKDGSYGACTASRRYTGEVGDLEMYHVGPTSFAVFTLRKCGVPRNDRALKRSLKWLKKTSRKGWNPDMPKGQKGQQIVGKGMYRYSSYEAASVIMMLAELNRKDPRRGKKPAPVKMSREPTTPVAGFKRDEWRWMHELVQFLINNPHPRMPHLQKKGGGWRYWPPYKKIDEDLSATQFALLGLRAAVEAGYPVHKVEAETWAYAAEAARNYQRGDGGFAYQQNTPWTAGMTAAGIACLLICKEQLANQGRPVPGWIDERVGHGLEFLGNNLDFTKNTHGPGNKEHGTGYHYYHLYGIERVGALSGKHEIGGKAWYPRGAKWLVEQQREDGSWVDTSGMRPRDVLGTCFALLFLKKATPPAVTYSGD